MEKTQLTKILSSLYDSSLDTDSAWTSYNSFIALFLEGDRETTEYLIGLIDLSKSQRLMLRESIAEKGFELTPNQLNQYILLIIMALSEYIEFTEH
jgi:hypothetical protein